MQHGFCSYFFLCCNLAIWNIFLSSNDTEDLYFLQALHHLYQCSFLCLKPVLCKTKEKRHQDFQVLVNTSWMHITFCFIVSMNRQIGSIQISSMQLFHNLTYCNSFIQIHSYILPIQKLVFSSKLNNSTYYKLTDEVFADHQSWMHQ
jgi:hypothetical protein